MFTSLDRINLSLLAIASLYLVQLTNAQLSSCAANPCKNGGKCIVETDTLYGFRCQCPEGYYGINCQNIRSGNAGTTGSGGSINIGGGGGSNSGGSINIGGGGNNNNNNGGSINIGGNFGSKCYNGGTYVRQGLPCICPIGYNGNRCEFGSSIGGGSGGGGSININGFGACTINPCYNRGTCQPLSMGGYRCSCPYGYTGSKCEYTQHRQGNRILGISLGSILPFLLFIVTIGLCIYCCCIKNRNNSNGPQGFFANNNIPFFNNTPANNGPQANFGPGMPNNRPFQPVYAANNARPPTSYSARAMPDPDEVFKTNASPPPYDQVVGTTKQI